jgi:hypothetical protein
MNATDDSNPERLRLTAEIRTQLERLNELESHLEPEQQGELRDIKANIAEYFDWNESDAQAVQQNMALRNPETGQR